MVVAVGVQGQFSQQFAGEGVDDPDLEVGDEEDDAGSGVGSADADVVQVAGDAQGDDAGGVDAVVADPVVGVGVAAWSGQRLGQGVVDRAGRGAVG